MPYITTSDKIRLHYEETGAGTPIVFLHGFTLDLRMWNAQRDYFSKHYRVIVLDMRGHGKSDAPTSGYSRDHRVEDLLAVLDNLRIDKCHIVGLSMGGTTALGFALKYQSRLLSLTLVSTSVAGWNVGKKFEKVDKVAKEGGYKAALDQWLDWALQWYRNKPEHAELAKNMEEMIREHSGAYWTDTMRGKYPPANDLENIHRITAPTLIMIGELDRIFVPLADILHEKIKGSKLISYPGVGHMINMEIPERFNRDLGEWLNTSVHMNGGGDA